MHDCPEISDLIVDYDAATLARRPVKKSTVLETLAQHQNTWGLRIARRFPAEEDRLDPGLLKLIAPAVSTKKIFGPIVEIR